MNPNKGTSHIEMTKKLRNAWYQQEEKSIIYIEDLSNELFYEIFDYLDGYNIYQAFSNLNLRFQEMLSSSILRLKINNLPYLDLTSQSPHMEFISQHMQKIISLRFMYTTSIDRFFTLMIFDSSFYRLESLVLIGIKPDDLLQRLSMLSFLPRLLSLVLGVGYSFKHFSEMYKLIFSFPVLKYITVSSEAYEPIIPLPIATNDQFSLIKYLNIDHSCSLEDLIAILSFTPRLNRLVCKELIKSNEKTGREVPFILANLTRIRIYECYLVFNKLETLMRRISSQLQVLRITTYWDETYLDADRWERLILQYMPYLEKFYFQHHEFIDDDFEVTQYHTRIDRFNTSFWFERRWIFELNMDINQSTWSEIIYSIHPYRKRWYELNEFDTQSNQHADAIRIQHAVCSNAQMTAASVIQCTKDIELIVTAPFFREYNELLTENTISLFALLQITRLDAVDSGFSISTLIDLIYHLPNLASLRISSSSLTVPQRLSVEQTNILQLVSNINKITKVNIQRMTDPTHIQFLIDLCPRMQYLEIGCSSNINIKSLIRFILTKDIKYIPHLYRLSLHSAKANDERFKELQDMINFEKLRHNYSIKHINNKIDLQWK